MSDGYRLDVRVASFGGWSLFYLLATVGTVLLVVANPTGSTADTATSAVLVVVLLAVKSSRERAAKIHAKRELARMPARRGWASSQ